MFRVLILFNILFFMVEVSALGPCPESYHPKSYHNCFGTFTFPEGQWKGDKYVGGFKDGNFYGHGTYTHENDEWKGDKYVGQFKRGKKHGEGTYTKSDGQKYIGEWRNGKPWKLIKYSASGSVQGTYSYGQYCDGCKPRTVSTGTGESRLEKECRKVFETPHWWNFGAPSYDRGWDQRCWDFVVKSGMRWAWVGDAETRRKREEKKRNEDEQAPKEADTRKDVDEKLLAEVAQKHQADSASADNRSSPENSEPQVVTVAVQSNISGARVFFTGQLMGVTDLSVEVPKGTHMLEVEKEGFAPFQEMVEIVESTALYIELEKDGAVTISGVGSVLARGRSLTQSLCKGEERICLPDPSKTLFVEIAAKRGLIPDTSGCDSGCDDCETDFDELAEKAGNQDKLKLFLSGRCTGCDLSKLDMRDIDLSTMSHWIDCHQYQLPKVAACRLQERAFQSFFDVRGSNLQGADFSGVHIRDSRTFPRLATYWQPWTPEKSDFEQDESKRWFLGFTDNPRGRKFGSSENPCHTREEIHKGTSEPGYRAPALEGKQTDLSNASFDRSDMRGTRFAYLKTVSTRFTNADLRGVSFDCSDMASANFTGSNLKGIRFGIIPTGMASPGDDERDGISIFQARGGFDIFDELTVLNLFKADFSNSDLTLASFGYVTLVSGNFSNATVRRARFGATDLTEANFSGADLRGAFF